MDLLQSNISFDNHILKSWNYLNNPSFILNENIHDLVRGYSFERSCENVRSFLKQFGYKKTKKQIEKIVTEFQSIGYWDFIKLISPLQYTELPKHVQELHDKINKFYDDQKKELDSYYPGSKKYMDLLLNPKQFKF